LNSPVVIGPSSVAGVAVTVLTACGTTAADDDEGDADDSRFAAPLPPEQAAAANAQRIAITPTAACRKAPPKMRHIRATYASGVC
jgi:hypothetical protein